MLTLKWMGEFQENISFIYFMKKKRKLKNKKNLTCCYGSLKSLSEIEEI